MKYRKDIQILRGIAVIFVLLFHLGMPGLESGFLGVDIFFVISGYLMAMLYEPGKPWNFFSKRANRLLPAYFATILGCLLYSIYALSPLEYSSVFDQAIFSVGLIPNIGFWFENSYFSKAGFKPLLHLWSLGVEIQFYILVPAFIWLFARSRALYVILLVGSMALCFLVAQISSKTAFFWMPLRLWEFLLGFGIAFLPELKQVQIRAKFRPLGTVFFALLFALAAIRITGEESGFFFGHPGAIALLVTLATAGVILFGMSPKIEISKAGTALEILGEYSYSIYLVHFPVIVFVNYAPFSGTIMEANSLFDLVFILVATGVLSYALHRIIEKPMRRSKYARRNIIALAVSALLLLPIGMRLNAAGVPEREMKIYGAWKDRDTYRCGKLFRILQPTAKACVITGKLNAPRHRTILVGNSHADSIKSSFASAARRENISSYFMVENNPLIGGVSPDELISIVLSKKIDSIVLHYSPKTLEFTVLKRLVNLAADASISIALIHPVPVWSEHVPRALLKNFESADSKPVQLRQDYFDYNKLERQQLKNLPANSIRFYEVVDALCKDSCELADVDGRPLYFDEGHLTLTGSNRLSPVFEKVFQEIIKR